MIFLQEGRCDSLNLPTPMCLPLRRASVFLRQRAREWTVTGLRMIRPSFTSLRICWPEDRRKRVSYKDALLHRAQSKKALTTMPQQKRAHE